MVPDQAVSGYGCPIPQKIREAVTVHSVPVTGKIHAKFASQMDFYLAEIRFLTDLAVNAKSCLNSNGNLTLKAQKAEMLAIFVYLR